MKVYESLAFAHAARCGRVLFRKEEVQILETAIREDAAELARLRAEVKRLREMRSRLKRLPRYYIEQWNGVCVNWFPGCAGKE